MLEDFANKGSEEISKFQLGFVLSPDRILTDDLGVGELDWESIKFGDVGVDKDSFDKRGIYAFVLKRRSLILPEHGYVLYIGIAGRRSTRTIRQRYSEYLNSKKVMKRPKIARMIGTWHSVLEFFFAPIDDDITSEQLELIEEKLNTALLPPFSTGDLEGEVRALRGAFTI
jgi:hypothetical protein